MLPTALSPLFLQFRHSCVTRGNICYVPARILRCYFYKIVRWHPILLASSSSFGDKPRGIRLDIHEALSMTPNAFCDR